MRLHTIVLVVQSLSSVQLFVTPWTVAHQAPLSMGFSRQEYWSGLPFLSPGNLPDPGIKPWSSALQVDSLATEAPGKPYKELVIQSCLTLCDPIDYNSLGSSVRGILQAKVDSHPLLQGIVLTQGAKQEFPALQADSLSSEPSEKPP